MVGIKDGQRLLARRHWLGVQQLSFALNEALRRDIFAKGQPNGIHANKRVVRHKEETSEQLVTLDAAWEELEALAAPGSVGRFKRRVHPESPLDLFIGVAKPANQRLVMMLASEGSLAGIERLPSSQGVEARVVRPGEDGRDLTLELALTDPRFTDIFSVLALDIVDAAAAIGDERVAVSEVVERLRRWQRFLEEGGLQGLSPERQRGLFAELWVMRDLLQNVDPLSVVQAWTGPEHPPTTSSSVPVPWK